MLLVKDRFKDFTRKQLADPQVQTEAILALSAASREDVDRVANAALAAGGSVASDPMEDGFMYARSFHDPDGHIWEVMWMIPRTWTRSSSRATGPRAAERSHAWCSARAAVATATRRSSSSVTSLES